jgi:hypothetical protein
MSAATEDATEDAAGETGLYDLCADGKTWRPASGRPSPAEIAAAKMREHSTELRAELDDCIDTMLAAIADLDGGELSRGRSGAIESHLRACDRAVSNYRLTQMVGKSGLLDDLLAKRGTP